MNKHLSLILILISSIGLSFGQTNHAVSVGGAALSFSPSSLTITQGDSVTWTNAGGFHNVNGSTATYASNPEGFANGGASSATWTYGFRFNTPGTYDYQCDPHAGAGMTGQITVQAAMSGIPVYDIATVHTEDVDGVADSLNVECELRGVVHSIDFDGNAGYSFYMADPTGAMNVFNFNDVNGYVVTIGDSIHVLGDIAQFNGLTEIIPDSIALISQGNSVYGPAVVSQMDETTEAALVTIQGFYLANPTQWNAGGGSFNVDFTDGTNTVTLRIDSDTDIAGTAAPAVTDTFDIIGVGGQFDNSNPFTEGYQLFPRSLADWTLVGSMPPPANPVYPINVVTTEDVDGVADSLNVACELRGVVHSIDFDGNSGYSFYIADGTGSINVFNFNDVNGYVVTIGDSIHVLGDIAQFNGLTEIIPDSIALISQGNSVYGPTFVSDLNDNNEASLVTISGFYIIDVTQWQTSGSFNVDFTNGPDTLAIRIDSDTDISGTPAPAVTDTFNITGVVSQFDNSNPFTEGYQLLPRSLADWTAFVTQPGLPVYDIATVSTEDVDGVADSLGVMCELRGVVYSGDFRGGTGLQFYFKDATGGINAFDFADVSNYQVTVGDSIHIQGEIGQFNGLTEIFPDSIILISQGNSIGLPEIVTDINNDNEGNYVKLNKFYLIDTTQWTNSGSGFNVDVTNGSDTLQVRIDNESFAYNMQAPRPTDTLNFSGAASQFDSSNPFTAGFQLLPSTVDDVVLLNADCLPIYKIATVHKEDMTGVADSIGVDCELRGVIHSIDFDGNAGYSFYIADETGAINVFDFSDVASGYQVTIGDSIHALGTIIQFNGLTELQVDSIALASQGNAFDTTVVTSLGEENEAFLVTVEGYHIVDATQWPGMGGSSTNLLFTNDTDTLTIRVDSDTDVFDNLPAPLETDFFNITGISSQFDNSAPRLEGYQILPRFATDFAPLAAPMGIPMYTIAQVHGEDSAGVADSLGVECELAGVVHSIDFDDNEGYSFYMADTTGFINVFNFNDVSSYQVTIGDSIRVQGTIEQFRGLTEIIPDSIMLVSQNNSLFDTTVVSVFDESNESYLVSIEGVSIVDTAQWPDAGDNGNVDFTDGTNTYVVRIDNATDVDGTPVPAVTDTFNITGIVTQFDNSSPFLEGYQLLPRFLTDFVLTGMATNNTPVLAAEVLIYPNPARDLIQVEVDGVQMERVRMLDMTGRELLNESVNSNSKQLNVSGLSAGMYHMVIQTAQGSAVRQVMIRK